MATPDTRPDGTALQQSADLQEVDPAPMTVVFERPYQFVPPIRSTAWPWLIQRLRLYDLYLRRNEGVVDYEIRGSEHLQTSLDSRHGILLAPNHCRYADPLIMGWPARQLGIHVHAMASWHLFNQSWLDSFAMRRMGAFSVFREGQDRQSLETAIDVLDQGERPLIVFPEGTTNRTNDRLKPLLDGVAFIARTAAKRRLKRGQDHSGNDAGSGNVVVHPVAIKYLCIDEIDHWATRQLDRFEASLGWRLMPQRSIRERTVQLAEAFLALKEMQFYGHSNGGDLPGRRNALVEHILSTAENQLKIGRMPDEVRERVRQIRSITSTRFFETRPDPESERQMRQHVMAADFAQDLASFPDNYLECGQATDTRIVETIQWMQESFYGKRDHSIPLKSVIEFAPAIEVDPRRPEKGQPDPLMQRLTSQLGEMIDRLSTEARTI